MCSRVKWTFLSNIGQTPFLTAPTSHVGDGAIVPRFAGFSLEPGSSNSTTAASYIQIYLLTYLDLGPPVRFHTSGSKSSPCSSVIPNTL